jgi:hypothetical protein
LPLAVSLPTRYANIFANIYFYRYALCGYSLALQGGKILFAGMARFVLYTGCSTVVEVLMVSTRFSIRTY